jgi:general stress protein YciG
MDHVTKYLRQIGSKGGRATGERKRRGDAEFYRELSRKAAAARAAKRAEKLATHPTPNI